MKRTIIILLLLMMILACAYLGANSRSAPMDQQIKNSSRSSGGIVNSSARVVIQNAAYVVISGQGNFSSQGTGTTSGSGSIYLAGNFINNNSSANPVSPTGFIRFSGTAAQTISGNPITFGNVSFDNTAGISIGCDTSIGGDLIVSASSGTILMTDYDFGVEGEVTGTPEIEVSGSGALGEVGENANVNINSSEPSGLPEVMNTLVVNPGAEEIYLLPNGTSVENIVFQTGSLALNGNSVLLRTRDFSIGGVNSLSALTVNLIDEPGTNEDNESIHKRWNITGNSSGELEVTLRWSDDENNGNDFSSNEATVWKYSDTDWALIGAYPISIESGYNLVSFPASFSAKNDPGDYTITGDNQTLPVVFSSFTGMQNESQFVRLVWITQSESNLHGYHVLRSKSGTLAEAIVVSNLIDATNTSSTQTYVFDDKEIETGLYYYWLMVNELDGGVYYHGPITVLANNGDNPGTPQIPIDTKLLLAYPNPFNPSTNIAYSLKEAGTVQFEIFNLMGQKVWSASKTHSLSGVYTLRWDGIDFSGNAVASGIYYYRMKCGTYSSSKKMVLLK